MVSIMKDHIHEFQRSKTNKEVYRCIHPKCPYYHRREFLIGKEAICRDCKNIFHLSEYQLFKLNHKNPICEFCGTSKKAQQMRAIRKATLDLKDDINLEKMLEETLE